MAKSFESLSPKDQARIKVDDPMHLEFWARELGVSKRTVMDAVRNAGPISADVRRLLRRNPRGLDLRGR